MKIRKFNTTNIIIFNPGTDLEFGECQKCGYEINPTSIPYVYPTKCPNCKREAHFVFEKEE